MQLVSITGADKAKIEQQVKDCGGKEDEVATTGNWANAATTGEGANAATTGEGANAATTGYRANAATTGEGANAATTGYRANAATTGNWANAATTGYRANAATTGEGANAANDRLQGERCHDRKLGERCHDRRRGERCHDRLQGERCHDRKLGERCHDRRRGERCHDRRTRCRRSSWYRRQGEGRRRGAIVLCYRNYDGELIHIRASKVGENGVKPDVWYVLDEAGEFVEVEPDHEQHSPAFPRGAGAFRSPAMRPFAVSIRTATAPEDINVMAYVLRRDLQGHRPLLRR